MQSLSAALDYSIEAVQDAQRVEESLVIIREAEEQIATNLSQLNLLNSFITRISLRRQDDLDIEREMTEEIEKLEREL